MGYFGKRYHPPGTPPGTLIDLAGERGALLLRRLDYSDTELNEAELQPPYTIQSPVADRITWLHVQGYPDQETLQQLGETFGLHPLALEDVANHGQRPKAEVFDEHLFVILNEPHSLESGELVITQVSFFLGDNFVISFHSGALFPFQSVVNRLRNRVGKIRQRGADYLLYALIDTIVDSGFPVLEHFGDRLEDLEEEMLVHPTDEHLGELHMGRRQLLMLRRRLWPQREVMNSVLRDGPPLITEETGPYLRDCYDHTVQIMDLLETYREVVSNLLDLYLSSVSNRMNEVMKVLTVIATIFIPLTFIAGVYGMNFGNNSNSWWAMPELRWAYGYPVVWLVMLGVAVAMVLYFRRKRWF